MKPEYGTPDDIASWMELVKKVSRSFPGLETEEAVREHRETVLRFMREKRALCIKENGVVKAVLLFSTKRNMICCLAAAPDFRRRGAASAMLSEALDRLDRTRPVTLTTFREDDAAGNAPRALYGGFGFLAGRLVEEFGYPNQEFVLPPKRSPLPGVAHRGTVKLETERLLLRRFVPNDLEAMFENCWSDFEVWRWTSYAPMLRIEDVTEKADMFTDNWLNAYSRPNRYSWAIELKDTGDVVGRMFGMHPDDELCDIELACELGRKWWNRGLMTEAVKAVTAFFFDEVHLNRIYAYHADKNPASGRMMAKCGMRYEGTMREACICNCGVFDKVNYAILAEDYRSQKDK